MTDNNNSSEFGKPDDFQSLFCAKCEADLEVWLDQDVFGMVALCQKCIAEEWPEEFT